MGPALAQNIVVIHVNAQPINAVKEEERSLSTSGPNWKNTELPSCGQPGSFPPYKSMFTMEPVENDERSRLLKFRDLVRKDFPGGKILDPYGGTWLSPTDGVEMIYPSQPSSDSSEKERLNISSVRRSLNSREDAKKSAEVQNPFLGYRAPS